MNALSKRPPPLIARAQDVVIIAWPSRARRKGPPLRDGPKATPIGKKRAFKSTAAAIARNTPPPAPMIAATANWAATEKVVTENAIGARTPQPRERARTPKDMATT